MRVKNLETGDEWNFDGNAWTLGRLTRAEGFGDQHMPYTSTADTDKRKSWLAGWYSENTRLQSRFPPVEAKR